MANRDLVFDLILNDKITQLLQKVNNSALGVSNKFKDANSAIKLMPNSIASLEKKAKELEFKLKNANTGEGLKHYRNELEKTSAALEKLKIKAGLQEKKKGFWNKISGEMKTAITGFGVIGAFNFAKDIAETTGKYEKYEAVLKNTFQSGTRAKEAMADIGKLAAQTPFQIDQLTESYVKLVNRGFTPTMSQMTNLGDLASSTGKDFGQLTEAILDAGTGEFERLKEFGIKGSKDSKKGTYTFDFKGVKTEVKANTQAVNEYMLSLGKLPGVMGSMAAISQTTEGAISNLSDSWDQMKAAMGASSKGVIAGVISGMKSLVDVTKSWFTIPVSEKLMQEQGDMNALVAVINDYSQSYETRNAALMQLQQMYPEYFSNMNMETLNLGKLNDMLSKTNALYEKKISLASAKEAKDVNKQALDEKQAEKTKAEIQKDLIKKAMSGDESAYEALMKNADFTETMDLKYAGIKGMLGGDKNKMLQEMLDVYDTKDIDAEITKRQRLDTKNTKSLNIQDYSAYLSEKRNLSGSEMFKTKAQKEEFKTLYNEVLGKTKTATDLTQGVDGKGTGAVEGRDRLAWRDAEESRRKLDEFLAKLNKTTDGGGGGGKNTKGTKSKEESGVSGLSGTTGAKNITINIQTLKGIEIDNVSSTEPLKERAGEEVLDILLRAINGVNYQ